MYFKPELITKILKGEKVQTRRIKKPGEQIFARRKARFDGEVRSANHRLKWAEKETYAVCPGRGEPVVWWTLDSFGQPCLFPGKVGPGGASVEYVKEKGFMPLRILVDTIVEQWLPDITDLQAMAEGFANRDEFFEAWDRINGKGKRHVFVFVLCFKVAKAG